MPFTSQEISDAGKIGLDFYLKNDPIDQVAVERPLLKALMGRKESAPGAKQYIVEQLRYRYQSNFQWFNGSATVTYNRRTSIEQSQYEWRSAHDGVALDEDRMVQNGISITDDGPRGTSSGAEQIALTNLLKEQMAILRKGFEEQFSYALHKAGTSGGDDIVGLDALISTTPTTGTVGNLNRANFGWWRNNVATSLDFTVTTGTGVTTMESTWRACARNGGQPNFIIAGSTIFDAYRDFVQKTYGQMVVQNGSQFKAEGGNSGVFFKGVEVQWSPEFYDLQNQTGNTWEKRMYFLNLDTIRLRPMEGHDMVSRKPPRPYDRYEWYWALVWRGALTMNRSNANAVLVSA